MKEFYLYSEKQTHNIIKQMFINFNVNTISTEKIKKNNIFNQNILLIIEWEPLKLFNESFFLNNNVVIFYTKNKIFNEKKFIKAKVFTKHINVNKFIDEVTTYFVGVSLNYADIKILGEKIINKTTQKEIPLTNLERDIIALLIDQKKIEKDFLLENVLKIKKNTETKTIESHLTRIRNKLIKINSKLKILSKGEKVFLSC